MAHTSEWVKWILIYLIILSIQPVSAQEAFLVTSHTAVGSGGESTYSVGQVAFNTFESATGTVTQGVQQPYEILFMTGLEDPSTSLTCYIFPNPSTSEVRLKTDGRSFEFLTYNLMDLNGVILREGKITEAETVLPMNDLPSDVYFLALVEHGQTIMTWKVIKK
jgi:hypothetical protein